MEFAIRNQSENALVELERSLWGGCNRFISGDQAGAQELAHDLNQFLDWNCQVVEVNGASDEARLEVAIASSGDGKEDL